MVVAVSGRACELQPWKGEDTERESYKMRDLESERDWGRTEKKEEKEKGEEREEGSEWIWVERSGNK